ncbi:glycosyltransferase [Vibrio furnissii]|uniref:glycosyltransferase n=1 Tax=Vibrio furnissii TaxID=29494 RepID=UPI0013024505|nr:glycosyltransferase [Vibrio furnissii]
MSKIRRVAFPTSGFMYWNGGLDFLKNLVYVYAEYCAKNKINVEVFVIIPKSGLVTKLKNFIKKRLKRNVVDENKVAQYFCDIKGVKFISADYSIDAQAKMAVKNNVDILLPCFYPVKRTDVNWIGYLFDCQHIGLPENFTETEILERNRDFQSMLSASKSIVVNSIDTRLDLEKYFYTNGCSIHSFPFCPTLKSNWKDFIKETTSVSGEYFIVCNQFWKHKNHITVFKAFLEYCKSGGEKNLVCTGSLYDYRDSTYYKEIKEIIDTSECSNRIIITGFIDKKEQIKLLYNSVALIQPTLFEGGPGGGAVYDAVALGKPVIMSDIAINQEVEWDRKWYFSKLDSHSLFKVMSEVDVNLEKTMTNIEELNISSERNKDILGRYIHNLITSQCSEYKLEN